MGIAPPPVVYTIVRMNETPLKTRKSRQHVNITLSDRAFAIVAALAEKDSTSMSSVIEIMAIVELTKGGRITNQEADAWLEIIRQKRAEKAARKTVRGKKAKK